MLAKSVLVRAADRFKADVAVVLQRQLAEQVIANRVQPEKGDQVVAVNDVALRFAHFTAVHQKPRVTEHLLRQRQVERHEENRPVDGVETDDVLADEVQVCRPITLELLGGVAVAVITDAGDVVCERVKPNIHDVLVVKIDRQCPT